VGGVAKATKAPEDDSERAGRAAIVEDFFMHGIRHILTGYDHLLFACALVLAVSTLWELAKVVTAFTVAHSITLTLATFGVVAVPSAILEPLISASIVVVALMDVLRPGSGLDRARLGASFAFGLLHGLAFAGGLLEVMHRMPHSLVVLAILGFSVGVEVGHQIVLLPLFGMLRAIRRLPSKPGSNPAARARRIGSSAIAVAGLYYFGLALSGS
jgi:hydrogenase/urease accessory protein HupE